VRIRARVVFNATGAWADRLRSEVGGTARLRPLRGSHLVFPSWRFPLAQAVSFCHPIDRRPVFAFPWEGVTLVGTTDVDHDRSLDEEPAIAAAEASYLLAAVRLRFPALDLGPQDVVTTYSGVRPVVGTGKADPSKESREHVIWNEDGLITVTGGKLTTFRLIALDALHAARSVIPGLEQRLAVPRVFDPPPADGLTAPGLSSAQVERLTGRYGTDAPQLVAAAHPGELERIPGTDALWAELRWAARSEAVVHLDDLLLRRVRLGLLLPRAASSTFPRLREICAEELGWTDRQWDEEEQRYTDLWEGCYRLPQLSVTEMDRSTAGLAEGIENDPAARGSA
jgi:glycerol-3-phosphate dehydrogenase